MRPPVAALALAALGLAGGAAACGGSTRSPMGAHASAGVALGREAGSTLMAGISGARSSPELLGAVRDGRLAGVVLFGLDDARAAEVAELTRELRAAAASGGQPPPLVALDQEGGEVKRLPRLPPALAPERVGRSPDVEASARREGRTTGRALRGLGIVVDLAPVADVPGAHPLVPSRYFGSTPRSVAEGATGFALGLRDAGVLAAAKHFPGPAGADDLTTDARAQVVHASREAIARAEEPYRRLARAHAAPIVMVSSASYPRLDPGGAPAIVSRAIAHDELDRVGLAGSLRMTDDLATGALAEVPGAPAAALRAGADLVFVSGVASAEGAAASIVAAVRDGTLPLAELDRAGRRVAALRRRLLDQPAAAGWHRGHQ